MRWWNWSRPTATNSDVNSLLCNQAAVAVHRGILAHASSSQSVKQLLSLSIPSMQNCRPPSGSLKENVRVGVTVVVVVGAVAEVVVLAILTTVVLAAPAHAADYFVPFAGSDTQAVVTGDRIFDHNGALNYADFAAGALTLTAGGPITLTTPFDELRANGNLQ
jgi:hypothetical protein